MDSQKIKAAVKWLKLRNVHELRGFLGLASYYRKFVASYGQIAWVLTDKLKKDCF